MQLTLVTGPLVPHEIYFHGYKHESESTYICMDNIREYPKRHSSYLDLGFGGYLLTIEVDLNLYIQIIIIVITGSEVVPK